ncbi:MAG: hypothetical protein IT383_20245 [Deltaproteobacteria bacterium]|nr:hypothetical protein [Deltaproteobacteria bacterium]
MSFPLSLSERPFARRSAFILNANARGVSDRLIERLAEVVPAGDLFLSRTLEDAEIFVRTVARRGYGRIFLGGGDGTLVSTLKLLREVCAKESLPMPELGVLRLGTGNAMALALGAAEAVVDASHVVNQGPIASRTLQLVETDDGTLTPFAGIGYDGAVLNDYYALRAKAATPLGKKAVATVWGYLAAMLFKTVPDEVKKKQARVRITTKSDAIAMVSGPQGDEEQPLPAGSVLYEGPAPVLSVGAIPFFGYGFTMFPFAGRKEGYVQLRVCSVPIPILLANLFPSVWRGRYRHAKLKDFLVKDVVVESDQALPYQVGGDAHGYRSRLAFKVAAQPLSMLALGERLVPQGHTVLQLGPARVLVRLPR